MHHSEHPGVAVSMAPAEPLSWVFFCADTYAAEQFSPAIPAIHRPASAARNSEDWREWREMVWAATVRGNQHFPQGVVGFDPPDFASLGSHPTLQGVCRSRWADFRTWWRAAKAHVVATTTSPKLAELVREARAGKEQPLTVHVVPLQEPQDLASWGTQHLVSVGLLEDREACARWLRHQD